MLQQMIHVIGGMKDKDKLGKLQAVLLQRVCEVSRTDPVTHLQLLAGSISERFTHEEADHYAQLRFGSMEPEEGETAKMFHGRLARERQVFKKLYPNWKPHMSATAADDWRPGGQAGIAADPLREWGDAV
jgi:hypothetical protein